MLPVQRPVPGLSKPAHRSRNERLQVMLTAQEVGQLDDFRFENRLPTRAAAVRELLRRGLAADGEPRRLLRWWQGLSQESRRKNAPAA
jgi:hypothetical protein